jgi:serine/threonine protein kinase
VNKTCDDQRLYLLLRGEEASAEFHAAEAHVEACPRCRSRIEQLAADAGQWVEARQLLSADAAEASLRAEQQERAASSLWLGQQPALWTETMIRQVLAPPSHPEMLGRLGRYEIERLIGAGGMGIVLKGFDTELNRPVAIKVLAPHLAGNGAARQRFAREARAAAAVVHEHVVAIHNVETEGAAPFLVMQLVAGESLQARLDHQGPLALAEILRIAHQTAAGLAAAHAQGLVHRDVKPSNILLEEGVERALLTDFGLARAADDASLTHTGFLPGTPHYMSPEQARGEAIDGRSDLFSLGSVMYAMCSGRPPFRADTSFGVLRRITDHHPRPIREVNPDIPDWLEGLIEKLHAKRPADRFASAAEVADLLKQCLAHVQQPATVLLPEACRTAGRVGQAQRRPTARNATIAIGLAILAAASAIFIFARQNGDSQPQPSPAATSWPITPGSTDAPATDWNETAQQIERVSVETDSFQQRVEQLWDSKPTLPLPPDSSTSPAAPTVETSP